jgi:hypothetical protein
MALEELKFLQDTIGRMEGIRLQLRGWNIVLLTALTAAFLAKDSPLSKGKYVSVSIGLSLLFFWLETVHRVAENRAIKRSNEVEAALRVETDYDGPRIGLSMSRANNLNEQLAAMNNIRMYLPYIVMTALSVLIAFAR